LRIPAFLTPTSGHPRFPLRESSSKKTVGSQNYSPADAIQDWVSSFFAEELPGRAARERALRFSSANCLARVRLTSCWIIPPSITRTQGRSYACSPQSFSSVGFVRSPDRALHPSPTHGARLRHGIAPRHRARPDRRPRDAGFYRGCEHRDRHSLQRNQRRRRPLRDGAIAAGRLFRSCGSARHVAAGHTAIARRCRRRSGTHIPPQDRRR
jgi:hypothetical protein